MALGKELFPRNASVSEQGMQEIDGRDVFHRLIDLMYGMVQYLLAQKLYWGNQFWSRGYCVDTVAWIQKRSENMSSTKKPKNERLKNKEICFN